MIPSLRSAFNRQFREESYVRFLALLEERTGVPPLFRHNETPVFLPTPLVERMDSAGREMVEELLDNATYLREARERIPPPYRVPREAAGPLFVQADFGLIRDEQGALHPRLVEIQGFPSLYAYQPVLAETYRDAYGLDPALASLPHGLDRKQYFAILREAITAGEDPAQTVLLEIDPDNQKTRVDFALTERECGIRTVDVRQVRQRGNKLFYRREGGGPGGPGSVAAEIEIRRIYNRVIVDELERRGEAIPFAWNDDLDVEWAGHPNWFFLLSKFSLPWLRQESVPETWFLDQAPAVDDLENWVLKPLFSFAGIGVVVGPTREQLDAIPAARRHDYILQRRMRFEPTVETPYGPTQIEVRIMYIERAGRLEMVNIILRSGRGKMMGVDHNKGLAWVGATAAFLCEDAG